MLISNERLFGQIMILILISECINYYPKFASDFEYKRIFVFGKWNITKMMIFSYGDEGTKYTYSGTEMVGKEYTEIIKEIKM